MSKVCAVALSEKEKDPTVVSRIYRKRIKAAQMTANQLRIALAFVLSIFGSAALAEDGVSDSKIVFGQVAALTGPAQDLGQGMRQGILAAFDDANRHGGISGRTLELNSLDDGYEPEKTIEATKKIIEDDKVFAMIGAVGTPTSKASQPIATA